MVFLPPTMLLGMLLLLAVVEAAAATWELEEVSFLRHRMYIPQCSLQLYFAPSRPLSLALQLRVFRYEPSL